jgi:hypothetical protein
LTWPTRDAAPSSEKERPSDGHKSASLRSWLLPLVGLVLVLAAAGAGVYWVKMMAEEPPRPAITDNFSATEKDGSFIPDVSAPKISNIKLINLNYNTVKITWDTDEPSDSRLIWHIKDGSPQTSELKGARDTSHFIELTGLKNKSTFFYKVRSVDEAGNEAVSIEKTFDVGIPKGIARVEVVNPAYKQIEPQPGVFKTIIYGGIRNTGETTLNIGEIAVDVTVSVTGKPGVSTVQASLDPYPTVIYPLEVHNFSAEVPNRTGLDYKVEARIIQEKE